MQRSASVTLDASVSPVGTIDPDRWPEGVDTWPPDATWGPWGHGRHAHSYGQLVYAASGTCTLETPAGSVTVDDAHAVWIPRGVEHSARFDAEFCPVVLSAPTRTTGGVRTIVVDPAARASLLACRRDPRSTPDALRALVGPSAGGVAPETARTPHGPLTAPIAAALAADPAHPCTLETWAQRLHVSSVSIRRAFLAETGLPFSQWRTRVRLDAAVTRLRLGEPVTAVAHAVGLSHNGLLAACRRHLGLPPSALHPVDDEPPRS
ncbi:AraC family transcriptional regulator [Cellulomonas sp. Leaf334]|uniref:AraC family transcriptional regulator n=1 Tax=Cellulomonas sp. Leaf334 TaxID=1736339 RepID=UPI0006FCB498|nr:AraC family transcriptional regulator [Cellulomonas sp. Leaf334]KQR16500.1 hypothetical protein ASF78_03740 [Cellulomonas sp. Leaf334]